MPFDVKLFASNIQKYGTIQNNKFEVKFNRIPKGLQSTYAYPEVDRLLIARANTIRVPGNTLDAYENRRYGIGPKNSTVTNINYQPINISFIETADGNISKFFYDWTNLIFNVGPEITSYNVAYKDDYITEVDILVYNNWGKPTNAEGRDSKPSIKYSLYEVFPLTVSDNDLAWDETNSLLKVNVSFAFSYFQKNTDQFNSLRII